MRAAVMNAIDEPLEIADDVEIRDPGAGEVLVRVSASGVCHSDLSVIDGSFPSAMPVVLGHEAAGVVAAVGPGVRKVSPGDHVILTPVASCGTCYWCVRGETSLCIDAMAALFGGTMADGVSPLSRAGATVYRGLAVGAFAEHALMPASGVVPIAADIPLDVACVIGCAVQTGVGAVLNTAGVEEGATVLVLGAGGIGVSVIQGARLAAAARIIVVDPVAERREMAMRFGATDAIDPDADDVVEASRQLTGGIGVDYAFEAAGRASLIETGILSTRAGGTTVCVGAPPVTEGISIPGIVGFTASEKKLIGCLLGSVNSHRDIPRLIALWQAGRLDLEAMITHRCDLDHINDAFDTLRRRDGLRTAVSI